MCIFCLIGLVNGRVAVQNGGKLQIIVLDKPDSILYLCCGQGLLETAKPIVSKHY